MKHTTLILKYSNLLYNIANSNKPEAISNRPDRQSGGSEIEMGHGIQRDPGGIRRVHESSDCRCPRVDQWSL